MTTPLMWTLLALCLVLLPLYVAYCMQNLITADALFYCSYFINEETEALRGQVRSGRSLL